MGKKVPEFERVEGFPMIARVKSLDDFSLWQYRDEYGIKAITCTYPEDPASLKDISDKLVEHARNFESDDFNPLVHDNMTSPSALRAQFCIYERGWRPGIDDQSGGITYPKTPQKIGKIDGALDKIVHDLSEAFFIKAGASPGKSIYALHARVNSDYPRTPHKHDETIAMSLTGEGTVLYADEEFEQAYTLKAGEVALFDKTMFHNSPEYDKNWEQTPRTNLIIG